MGATFYASAETTHGGLLLPQMTAAQTASPARVGYAAILASSEFRGVLPPFLLSAIGDGMTAVAVPLLALNVARGPSRSVVVGLAVALYTLPGVVPVVFLRRRLQRLASLVAVRADAAIRAVCLGSIPVLAAADLLRVPVLLAALSVSALFHSWGAAGRYSFIAEVADDETSRLVATSMLSGFDQVATILGPLLAALLISLGNATVPIAVDAGTFVILLFGTITRGARQAIAAHRNVGPKNGLSARALLKNRAVVGLIVVTYFYFLLYGPVEVALPLLIRDAGSRAVAPLGIFWSVFGTGAVIGSLAGGKIPKRLWWIAGVISIIGWGAAILPIAWVGPSVLALVAFGFGGLLYAPYPIVSYTFLQTLVPREALLSVLAIRSALMLTAGPVGAALGGPIAAGVGSRNTFAISGGATVALGILAVGAFIGSKRKDGSSVSGFFSTPTVGTSLPEATPTPWVVIPGAIEDSASVIETYTASLRDLSGACSEGETRIAEGRQIANPTLERIVMDLFRDTAQRLGITIDDMEPLEVLRYKTEGEYSWHADNEWTAGDLRKLSIVITLNSDFEGGGTEFMWPRPGVSEVIRPAPGGAVIFPSPLYHRAVRTDAGERWVLVGWATGPRFT